MCRFIVGISTVLLGLVLGCSEKDEPATQRVADSLDAAAEVLYDQGRYRSALRLYEDGLDNFGRLATKEDSLLKSSLLIGIAYSRYRLGMSTDEHTWLQAWRLAQASDDPVLIVQMTQAAAAMHGKRDQHRLEIKALTAADSVAAKGGVPDSMRAVVQSELKQALYDCYVSDKCKVPESVVSDIDSISAPMILLGILTLGALVIILFGPRRKSR